MMSMRSITFSNETRWMDRTGIRGNEKPGVYVLALFAKRPSKVDLQTHKIIYEVPLKANKNTAVASRTGNTLIAGRSNQLFVAAFPILGLSDNLCPRCIRYVERKLILAYALKWGMAPECDHE
jgi:hypothetical protein